MSVRHRLSAQEALARIKCLLGGVKEQHADKISDLKEGWRGSVGSFSFTAMGFAVSGTLTVSRGEVDLDATIPWMAIPFKGKIESVIRPRAVELLA